MADKKKKNRTGKTAPKKKAAVSRKQKPSPAAKAAAEPQPSSQRAPLYLLIILILLAVIIILANQYFTGERGRTGRQDSADATVQKKMHKSDTGGSSADKGVTAKEDQSIREQKNAGSGTKESSKTAESRVKIYFLRIDDRTEHVTLVPIIRQVKGEASLEKALGELIKGPNAGERSKGILSAVPSNIRIRGISIKNGIAEIDFNDAVEKNAAGSILINRLDQIIYTATEIDEVRSVIIKINGKRKQMFGSDGLSIGGPLHRRQ